VLVRAAPMIINFSIEEFREQCGQPETVPVSRTDCKELPWEIPSQIVLPLDLGKRGKKFILIDAAALVLCDFGEVFAPINEQRLARQCNLPAVQQGT
jgi:serine/threonine-protein kinase SRPK3